MTTTPATVPLAPVASGGSTASFTTTFALNTDHTLRATYGGSATFNGSSASILLRVQ